MKILVTGIGGLVGGHVAREAARAGHEVHGIVRKPCKVVCDAPLTFHVADLLETRDARNLIERVRPTHIVHAAWETTHGTYWNDPVNWDWVTATASLATAFAAVGGQRFVQIGTCAEYDWGAGICIEGITPERPITQYGLAKLAAFEAIQNAASGSFQAINARIFFAYGPRENPNRLIPYICQSHASGKVPLLSSGRQQRDLLFIEDVATAILALLQTEKPIAGPVNIGSGRAVSLAEAASILTRIADASESGLGCRPDSPDDPVILLPDTNRLFSTRWRPRVSLEVGLSRTYRWWSSRLLRKTQQTCRDS